MNCLFSSLLATITGILTVQAASITSTWTLAAGNIAPDGFTRSASLVNGRYPGPLLTANKGDSVTVNVINNLSDPTMRRSTSIHWHGLFLPRNAEYDGTSFVTQCPIAPGNSYPYFLALSDGQAGTFWYHSHLSTQYVDGVRGPLVIYDPEDPLSSLYDVDDAGTVITLSDWYHIPAPKLLATWDAGGNEPVPDAGLINGVGRFSGGPAVPRAIINVTSEVRYRFRIISLSASGQFEFSIANHTMVVIEADGVEHEPYEVNSIPILAGQRYSVVVSANQPINNYWISATQTVDFATSSPLNPNFNGTDNFAILHYQGAPSGEPTSPQPTGLPPGGIEFEEFNLKPLINPGAPGGPGPADRSIPFTFIPTASNVWTVDGSQYQSPSVPTLLNILGNGFVNMSQFPTNENTWVLQPNIVVEVNFTGGAGHPFHLHGHTFDVIQSASGGGPNYVNPPRRDVVASGGTPENPVRIRFATDNPGPWFIHCHIDWHLAAGLAGVFAEDPLGTISGPGSVVPNAAWAQLCKIYDSLPPSEQ